MIDRYGVHAIMGRPFLYADEVYQMRMAEAIKKAYKMRERATSYVSFQAENPELGNLLFEAQRLTNE